MGLSFGPEMVVERYVVNVTPHYDALPLGITAPTSKKNPNIQNSESRDLSVSDEKTWDTISLLRADVCLVRVILDVRVNGPRICNWRAVFHNYILSHIFYLVVTGND